MQHLSVEDKRLRRRDGSKLDFNKKAKILDNLICLVASARKRCLRSVLFNGHFHKEHEVTHQIMYVQPSKANRKLMPILFAQALNFSPINLEDPLCYGVYYNTTTTLRYIIFMVLPANKITSKIITPDRCGTHFLIAILTLRN